MKMSFKIFFLDDLPEYSYFVIYFFLTMVIFMPLFESKAGLL